MGKQNRTTPKYPQMQTKEWQDAYKKRMGIKRNDTRRRAKDINDYIGGGSRFQKKGSAAAKPAAAKRAAAKPAAKSRPARSSSTVTLGH